MNDIYANDFYVSITGNDSNDGSSATPWKTIQYSANNATAGSTVHISAGTYFERVLINVSGNADDGFITFLGDPAGGTIIDGSGFTSGNMESFKRPALDLYGLGDASALLEIIDQSYVRVKNIEIRNYICRSTVIFPMGIMVLKKATSGNAMQYIELVNLDVHDIKNSTRSDSGGAQGLAVYGGHTAVAITNLKIIGCEIHSCVLAQSESMTVNGNVDGFYIADNSVHDNDNIGIVCIGWEGTAGTINTNSNPAQVGGHHPNDRARNGVIRGNLVYNCSTEKPIKNPTYPVNDFSAGGIYIDGGKDITIEYNRIYQCDVGIEIASEHGGVDDNGDQRNTSGIICRNNLVYYCGQYGIGIGGYDARRGDATACKILHNTVYKCSSLGYGGGQIYINKAHHNLISGNILVARGAIDVDDYDGYNNSGDDWEWDHGLVLGSSLNQTYNHDNILDSNLYYTAGGPTAIRWKWAMTDSQDPDTGFNSLKVIDVNAVFGNPEFINATISKADGTENFALAAASPAIDEADPTQIFNAGTYDFAGNPRVYNAVQDNGAYEYYPAVNTSMRYPFPQSLTYPFGVKPDNLTQSAMNDKVKVLYDSWKLNYLVNDFSDWNGHEIWRVKCNGLGHADNTVSEGQGYGMLLMVMMAGYDNDARQIFDGMYWFFKKYQNSHGLMKWEILRNGDAPENDNATDGDMDIAMALIMADRQWGSSGDINYAAAADALIAAIMKWNVDTPADDYGGAETDSWRLTGGDWWAGGTDITSQLTRLSDFMVNHLRTFARITENDDWNKVMERCYTLIDKMQQDYSSANLLPDFIRDNTEAPAHANDIESAHDGGYDYNSCRVPWRVTIDYLFTGEPRSKITMNKIASFIKTKTGGDPDAVCDGYLLNGDVYGDNYGPDSVSEAFLAPFGVAGMVDAAHQTWVNDVFSFMTSNDMSQGYYEDSLRLLASLVMSGNWWSPIYSIKEDLLTEIAISAVVTGSLIELVDGDSTPSVIDGTEFGNVDSETETVTKTFVIKNLGTVTLSIGNILFAGAAAADFTVTTQPAAAVAPNETTNFSVTFSPTVGGERVAEILIFNNDSDENPFNFTLHAGASDTINVIDGHKVATGLQFKIAASEVADPSGGTLSEFVDSLNVYASCFDPVKGGDKKMKIKVLTDLPAAGGSQVTEVVCEWQHNILLYDKRALQKANKAGTYTADWLINNPINNLSCYLRVQTCLADGTRFGDDLDKKLFITSPEITDIENLDGTILGTGSVQPGKVIVLKGKYFGYKPPKVWIEYLDKHNKIKKQQLKIKKVFKYKDPRGNEGKSCMNLLTGDSEIRIQMPSKWWRGWTGGPYTLIIDNNVGLDTASISTADAFSE
ncbi:MAG: glycosyl hydrolase family 8 [Victivallaceae bacterium]|nr:glycosyl hydrolase family 8 [Victivallaceae bacterium]